MSPTLSPHWIPVLLKDTQPQATPDLEEEIVYRDLTMVTVSMGIVLTGAEVKGVSFVLASSRSIAKEGIEAPKHFLSLRSLSNDNARVSCCATNH